MGKHSPAFELERFESIGLDEELTLLRVAGRWRAKSLTRVPVPVLLVRGPRGEEALDELPDPSRLPAFADAEPPPWRAAYSLPRRLNGTRFVLRAAGRTIELPPPVPVGVNSAALQIAPARVAELERELDEAERELSRSEEALDLAGRRLAEEIERRQAAEQELAELEEEFRRARPAAS